MNQINKKFKKVTHVIFDMDGVLLDTERLYTKATQNIVSKFGKDFTWHLKLQMMGLQGKAAAELLVKELDLPITAEEYMQLASLEYSAIANIAKRFGKVYTPKIMSKVIGTVERESSRIAVTEMQLPMSVDSFQKEFHDMSHKLMNNVPLMPGAQKLVTHLYQHNIPIAVATSSGLESFELKTKKHKEFFSLFNHIVCGGSDPEVKAGKPAPDIFLICASRFADKPANTDCLVFEDAPNGVKAGIKAGMQVVMVPDENVPPEMLTDADLVVKSLDETELNLFGLPPMN